MSEMSTDVAIVGYGPVGAFVALLLAEEGLRVAILERSTEPVVLPRAVGLDGESTRAFQRIGLGDAVAKLLQAPREKDEFCFTDSARRRLFGVEMPLFGHNGWRDVAFFDQPELEAFLREQVDNHPRIEVVMGREVVDLTQDAEGVELGVAMPGGEADERLRAAFAIGCDGASSFVRRALGIEWASLGYDQEWLVIDILVPPDVELPITMMQVCDPERLTTYVPVKDPNRRWEFQLLPGETREEMVRSETIERLLEPWLPREHYEIRRAAVYQFHAATAERLRVGRVFLAGDAAHQTPPFLGQGLNSGFRDAVSLAWRIPRVLAGEWAPEVLDAYQAERDLHARDLVERAVGIGKLMETLAAREAGLPDPYAGNPGPPPSPDGQLVPPLRGGCFVASQLAEGPAGRLLRQPIVRREGGAAQRLDELLGSGFALVGRSPADLAGSAEAAEVMRRLGVQELSLEGLEVVEGSLDALFQRHPAVLVRPDRYVYGAVDGELDLDGLTAELARSLALR